jgi:hypothetical protein
MLLLLRKLKASNSLCTDEFKARGKSRAFFVLTRRYLNYRFIMRFGIPKIQPLNLDLIELSGGGSMPAQFEGRLHDGGRIYIRYRYGWIEVYIAAENEDFWAHKPVRKERIGQANSGDMFLEQACELLGLTIQGNSVSVSEKEFTKKKENAPYQDFSGQTTYWEQFYLAVSSRGFSEFLELLRSNFAEVYCLKSEADYKFYVHPPSAVTENHSVVGTHFYIACNRKSKMGFLQEGIALTLQEIESHFDFLSHGIATKRHLPSFYVGSPKKVALEKFTFSDSFELHLRWSCHAQDVLKVKCAEDFCELHDQYFRYDFCFFDTLTGQPVLAPSELDRGWSAYSPDLGLWSKGNDNRLLGLVTLRANDITLGLKSPN